MEVFFVSLSFISKEIKWIYHLQYRHQKAAVNASGMYASIDMSADRRQLFPDHSNTSYSTELFHFFQNF